MGNQHFIQVLWPFGNAKDIFSSDFFTSRERWVFFKIEKEAKWESRRCYPCKFRYQSKLSLPLRENLVNFIRTRQMIAIHIQSSFTIYYFYYQNTIAYYFAFINIIRNAWICSDINNGRTSTFLECPVVRQKHIDCPNKPDNWQQKSIIGFPCY